MMSQAVASYDQLAHQVAALRQENNHLRRELEDNCNHLSKLETETFSMKVRTTHIHTHAHTDILIYRAQSRPMTAFGDGTG